MLPNVPYFVKRAGISFAFLANGEKKILHIGVLLVLDLNLEGLAVWKMQNGQKLSNACLVS